MQDEEEQGELIDFPTDGSRLPPQPLPDNIGLIADDHPLRRPLAVAIIMFLSVLAGYFIFVAIYGQASSSNTAEWNSFTGQYEQAGKITYEEQILSGNFLDQEMQHFQSEDGRRFTYVDSHEREGSPVTGYWRLIEN